MWCARYSGIWAGVGACHDWLSEGGCVEGKERGRRSRRYVPLYHGGQREGAYGFGRGQERWRGAWGDVEAERKEQDGDGVDALAPSPQILRLPRQPRKLLNGGLAFVKCISCPFPIFLLSYPGKRTPPVTSSKRLSLRHSWRDLTTATGRPTIRGPQDIRRLPI